MLKIKKICDDYFKILEFKADTKSISCVGNGSKKEWTSLSKGVVKLLVDGKEIHEIAESHEGQVFALDSALRKALIRKFPFLKQIVLIDYSVQIVNEDKGSNARVKVTIIFSDGENHLMVKETSKDIIIASFHAIVKGYKQAINKKKIWYPS
jgi:2-isopropylmalate synthase